MPIERKKGKAEAKDKKDVKDSFDEPNPHLEASEPDAAELGLSVPSVSEVATLHAVDKLEPADYPDPFIPVYESEVSSIYAIQVGNGCIIKTLHGDQVNVVFVPGATLIKNRDGRFQLKGRN